MIVLGYILGIIMWLCIGHYVVNIRHKRRIRLSSRGK